MVFMWCSDTHPWFVIIKSGKQQFYSLKHFSVLGTFIILYFLKYVLYHFIQCLPPCAIENPNWSLLSRFCCLLFLLFLTVLVPHFPSQSHEHCLLCSSVISLLICTNEWEHMILIFCFWVISPNRIYPCQSC